MERRLAERKNQFKKNFDDPRRKREDLQVQIRKDSREQRLLVKRVNGLEENDAYSIQAPEQPSHFLMQPHEWKETIDAVFSGIPEREYAATQSFRRLLSIEKNPPIQQVIDAGVVPKFVEFLMRMDRPELQFEAAWSLTNIASGTTSQTAVVVAQNAVPIFVNLLSSPKDDVREQAIWALGNIAGDCPDYRNLVLAFGGLQPLLVQLLESEKFSLLRNATWTLSNLCRGKPPPDFELVAPALSTLKALIYKEDTEVLTDASWALSYISDGENRRIEAVIESNVCPRMVELLSHTSPAVQTPALRTIGNIVTGTDMQTQVIIQCGALPCLLNMLFSPKRTIKKEACWAISNITAGNLMQIQEVINNGLIPPLIQLLSTAEFDIKKEAAWAISNAVSGGDAGQVEFLINSGCVKPLCDLLEVNDTKIVTVALEAIENILRTGKEQQEKGTLDENPYCFLLDQVDAVQLIERLQDHSNSSISEKAWNIIYQYFPYEEEPFRGTKEEQHIPEFSATAPEEGFNFGV